RLHVLRNVHEGIGHRGFRTVYDHLRLRFFWPKLGEDAKWYLRTCEECQKQQMRHVVIPPTVQQPQPLFFRAHCDTMFMSKSKGRYKGMRYILQARCSLTHWPEYLICRKETAEVIEDF
ncbi:hypothetical protein CALVIDRAFT_473548, partial [Calocera viscosa TUFC12733]